MQVLQQLQATHRDEAEREEWVWRLETGLSDANPKSSIIIHNILALIEVLLHDA